jgi:hypothetical protein
MRRTLFRIALGLALLLAVGAGGLAWLKCGPRPTPKGQQPLTTLTEASFETLRDAFNASADRTRMVALLSPT